MSPGAPAAKGLSDHDRARKAIEERKEEAAALAAHSDAMSNAGQVTVANLGSMAEAAILRSNQMEVAVVRSFTNILRATDFGSGLTGTILGAVGGIVGGLFSRKDPLPVRVAAVDDSAASKLKNSASGPNNVTSHFYGVRDREALYLTSGLVSSETPIVGSISRDGRSGWTIGSVSSARSTKGAGLIDPYKAGSRS